MAQPPNDAPDNDAAERPRAGVWHRVREVLAARPASYYLLLAILLALTLGVHIVYLRDSPRQFAMVLSLLFVFFLVVIGRALLDALDIARRHLHERDDPFRTTLGDREFMEQLGRRLAEKRKEL